MGFKPFLAACHIFTICIVVYFCSIVANKVLSLSKELRQLQVYRCHGRNLVHCPLPAASSSSSCAAARRSPRTPADSSLPRWTGRSCGGDEASLEQQWLNFSTWTTLTTMPGCTFIMNCQNILHGIKIQNDGADVMAARATLLVAYTVHPYQCINRCINVSVDDVYYTCV